MTVKRNPLTVAPGCIEPPPRFVFRPARSCVVLLALASALAANSRAASNTDQPAGSPHWAGQALRDASRSRPPGSISAEPAPAVIPELQRFRDPDGYTANYQSAGETATEGEAFFMPLGTNGRTCQTCHQPSAGWSITPSRISKSISPFCRNRAIVPPRGRRRVPVGGYIDVPGASCRLRSRSRQGSHPGIDQTAGSTDIAVQCGRHPGSLWLHHEPTVRIDKLRALRADTRQRLGLPPSAAIHQPSLPDDRHVGWA